MAIFQEKPVEGSGTNLRKTGAGVAITALALLIHVGELGGDKMTNSRVETERDEATEHLKDLEDGSGCTEIWEHLSERRDAEAASDD